MWQGSKKKKKKKKVEPVSNTSLKRILSIFQSQSTKREWIWIKCYWPLLSKQQQNSSFSFGEMLHNQRKQKEPNSPFPSQTSYAQR